MNQEKLKNDREMIMHLLNGEAILARVQRSNDKFVAYKMHEDTLMCLKDGEWDIAKEIPFKGFDFYLGEYSDK